MNIILNRRELNSKTFRFMVLDIISLLAVLNYIGYRFFQSTMFPFVYTNIYKYLSFGAIIFVGMIRYVFLLIRKHKRRNNILGIVIFLCLAGIISLPFIYIGWKHDYKNIFILPFVALCLYDMDYQTLLKSFVFFIGILLIVTIICSLAGVVTNLTYGDENILLGSYVTINTTDLASYTTFLILFSWCIFTNNDWKIRTTFVLLSGLI